MNTIVKLLRGEIQGINMATQFMLIALELVLSYFITRFLSKSKEIRLGRFLHVFGSLFYINLLFTLTVFRRPVGSRAGLVHSDINLGFGLRTGNPSLWAGSFSIMNILLFIPLGILLYLQFRKIRIRYGLIVSTLIGAELSLIIECTQLLTGRGMFEVTDLLTNTSGAFIGALLASFVIKIRRSMK